MEIYVFYIPNISNNTHIKKQKYFVTSQPLAVMSIITVFCEVTAYTYVVSWATVRDWKFFNSAVAKYSGLLGCDKSSSQHTESNSLELLDPEDNFFKMSELSRPMTHCPRTTSHNACVPELSHTMPQCLRTVSPNSTVSQNYLTQCLCPRTISHNDSVPELSHPMTQCPRTSSPRHNIPGTISPNDPVSQNYPTQWHCPRIISPNKCLRTVAPNDTVSQNYLTQLLSVPTLSHPMTQCLRTLTQWHNAPELSHPMTVTHCPRTPGSLDNNISEITAVPTFKQQTPVYKTVWPHSPKDCNFNVKFWSLT
jgi:hypothetical protein